MSNRYSEKLKEATYHFDELKNKATQRNPFHYELRAFLSSSRSVLQYVNDAVNGTPNQSWYDVQMKDPYLSFAKVLRDEDIHDGPITTRRAFQVGLEARVNISLSVRRVINRGGKIEDHGIESNKIPPLLPTNEATVSFVDYFDKWTGNETVEEFCDTLLSRIGLLIEEGFALEHLQ